MGRRPVIGITPGFMREQNKLSLGRGYVDGVNNAGGLAVILPFCSEEDRVAEMLDLSDGILFSGGADVDARYFGEQNLKCGGEITPERDSFELLLAKRAMERKMPMFGICRGLQLINIALGGSIYQDIYACPQTEQIKNQGRCTAGQDNQPTLIIKHWQEAPDWYPVHDVHINSGSMLHRILGETVIGTNSYHHQAIKAPGNGLSIVSAATDGIIEAVEGTGEQFILGVQWHPERMWREHPLQLKLFEALTQAAGSYHLRLHSV